MAMADIPAGTILEVKYTYLANAQKCMNVIHYKLNQTIINYDPILMTDEMLVIFSNNAVGSIVALMADLMGTGVTFLTCSCQMIYVLRYIVRDQDVVALGVGPDPCTAQNVQASIIKRGSVGTRSNIGGFHLGGLANNNYTSGLLTAGAFAKLVALADGLDEPVPAGDPGGALWEPCILNKEKIPNTDPVKYRITGGTLTYEWQAVQPLRTMSRRTVGRGI
jgi:hypothetical protein